MGCHVCDPESTLGSSVLAGAAEGTTSRSPSLLRLSFAGLVTVALITLVLSTLLVGASHFTGGCSASELRAAKAKVAALQAQLTQAHLSAAAHAGVRAPARPSARALLERTIDARRSSLLAPATSQPSPSAPALSPEAIAARRAAGQHPTLRLALVVPWLGVNFPSWFPYFVESCRRSDFIADVLIFHEDAQVPPDPPRNVRFINLGQRGLGVQFGLTLARNAGEWRNTFAIVRQLQLLFSAYPYLVTEYKPAYGAVFAPYLAEYSHWSYTDLDLVLGDLGSFVDEEELRAFDVLTYSFGDYERLYLRGQFTAHRNSPSVNTLYAKCPFLGAGLLRELQQKSALLERARAHPDEPLSQRFNSAEGCYSAAVASAVGVAVKYAIKGLADFTAGQQVHVVNGAIRVCNHTTEGGSDHAHSGAGHIEPCDPYAASVPQPTVALEGNQRRVGPMIPVELHSDCSKWIEAKYRLCANISGWDKDDDWNLYRVGGKWYRQRFVNVHPPGVIEGAFFHFQVWKKAYKGLPYGGPGLPPVGSGGFILTPRGILPPPGDLAPAEGAGVAAAAERPARPSRLEVFQRSLRSARAERDATMDDATALEREVQRQLAALDAV